MFLDESFLAVPPETEDVDKIRIVCVVGECLVDILTVSAVREPSWDLRECFPIN